MQNIYDKLLPGKTIERILCNLIQKFFDFDSNRHLSPVSAESYVLPPNLWTFLILNMPKFFHHYKHFDYWLIIFILL